MVHTVVKSDGTAGDLKVLQTLGLGLDEKALEAVQQWRWKPGLKDGKPTDVSATLYVTFRLPRNSN